MRADRRNTVPDPNLLDAATHVGTRLDVFPHVHVQVPGGEISAPGQRCESRVSVFVPEQVLEAAFLGKAKKLLESAGLIGEVAESVWRGRFVENNKTIGPGGHALKYLAPYVSRGCVANWRLSQCDAEQRGRISLVSGLHWQLRNCELQC